MPTFPGPDPNGLSSTKIAAVRRAVEETRVALESIDRWLTTLPGRAETTSGLPGGSAIHRAALAATGRHLSVLHGEITDLGSKMTSVVRMLLDAISTDIASTVADAAALAAGQAHVLRRLTISGSETTSEVAQLTRHVEEISSTLSRQTRSIDDLERRLESIERNPVLRDHEIKAQS